MISFYYNDDYKSFHIMHFLMALLLCILSYQSSKYFYVRAIKYISSFKWVIVAIIIYRGVV